jgi:hypothetical protein
MSDAPKLPGKLGALPVVKFSRSLPKSRAESRRTDVIYGVNSLGDLARGLAERLTPAKKA